MSNINQQNRKLKPRRLLAGFLIAPLLVCSILLLFAKIYLATPLAAAQVSRLLTDRLHLQVTVSRLDLSGAALRLTGISLANPPGFPATSMAAADSIRIAPQWSSLLLGRQSFRLLALEGIRLDLHKNSAGAWNFAELQRDLARPKPAGKELFIQQLMISKGSLKLDGRNVTGIALQVRNLSIKGSGSSPVLLTFEDPAHNRYSVSGNARGGKDPAFDLDMTAPGISAKGVAGILGLKEPPVLTSGSGDLRLTAALHKGLLTAKGSLSFGNIVLSSAPKAAPLAGKMSITADYELSTDRLRLETLSLNINGLLRLAANGSAHRLRTEREFTATVDLEQADIGSLARLVPQIQQRQMVIRGRLVDGKLNLSGNGRHGIKTAKGSVDLRDGTLLQGRRTFVNGLSGTVRLLDSRAGFVAKGRLAVQGPGPALLEALDAPFMVSLSRRLKPLAARSDNLSARMMEIPVTGRMEYSSVATNRFSLALQVPATAAATFNPLLEPSGLQLASGTAAVSLRAAGGDIQDVQGAVRMQLSAVKGKRGSHRFTVDTGIAAADLTREEGRLIVAGSTRIAGLDLDGKQGEAAFAYRYADRVLVLSNGRFRAGDTLINMARVTGQLPVRSLKGETISYPLAIKLTGGSVTHRKIALTGLAGAIQGAYLSGPGEKWLEGTADLDAGQAAWEGMPIVAPAIHCTFARSGAKGVISGTMLGGTLKGEVTFLPFAPMDKAVFNLGARQLNLPLAAGLVPETWRFRPTEGVMGGTWNGSYDRSTGLDSRFSISGTGLALKGSGGKTLVDKAGIELAGSITGQRLEIGKAHLTAGEALTMQVGGMLAQPFTQQREGHFSFNLNRTALTDIIDPFVNFLPRLLQEATVTGTLAAEGKIDLHQGRQLLDGAIHLNGIGLSAPDQKVNVTGVDGTLPFSFDLAGGALKTTADVGFSRDNYARLLADLRRSASSLPALRIARVAVGSLEMNTLALSVTAANGVTRIDALEAPFYGGTVFGIGTLTMDKGLNYRSDLLINGVSLKQLCAEFPGISGYISGLVDGIVSLSGKGSDKAGLRGFVDLWARRTRDEKMLISKAFLQRLSGQKLRGFFFRNDRAYDKAEIKANLEAGYLTFDALDIEHTNLFGMKDLSVTIAATQNRIALDHLFTTIGEAAARGRTSTGAGEPSAEKKLPAEAPADTEFKWQE